MYVVLQWANVVSLSSGIGYATQIVITYAAVSYIVIQAWAFFYLFSSFTAELPWASCKNSWNTGAWHFSHCWSNMFLEVFVSWAGRRGGDCGNFAVCGHQMFSFCGYEGSLHGSLLGLWASVFYRNCRTLWCSEFSPTCCVVGFLCATFVVNYYMDLINQYI